MDENHKNKYFDSDFFVSFLDGLDHHNRYVVTVINSICKDVISSAERDDSPKFIQECMEKIIYQCSQIMKLSEVYDAVANLMSDKDIEMGSINAGAFVSDFFKNCTEHIKSDICRLTLKNSLKNKDIYISFDNLFVDKKILEFVMTVSLRKMIINGARKIDLIAESANSEIIITLKTVKAASPVPEEIMPELISVDLSDNIIKASADRLKSKFDVSDKEAVFRIPTARKIVLGQPIRDQKGYFNLYNNLLSDIETIISYTKDNKK